MRHDNHDSVVHQQFDSQARAYLHSATHASGADLAQMAERVGHRPDAVALDVGCGGGHVTFRLAALVRQVVACDLSAGMLQVVAEEARQRGLYNVQTQQCAVEALPFPDAAFDIAATRFSAHHWRDLPGGLAQMRRVLKPGGMALFMDVVSPGDFLFDTWLQGLELLRDPSHVRDASVPEWHALLCAAGFTVQATTQVRLRLDFGPWVERIRTPPEHVAALRSLQQRASAEVRDYFALEADGSFTVDTALIAAF